MLKYTVAHTAQFKKDYKRAVKRGLDVARLKETVTLLAQGEPLADKFRDHGLTGRWAAFRECHIQPDWLLIYRLEEGLLVLTLARTGSHADLFDA